MAKEIKVKIVVDDDGSLKVVAGEATKASKATDKLDKSGKRLNKTRGNFHKLEKVLRVSPIILQKHFLNKHRLSVVVVLGLLVPMQL